MMYQLYSSRVWKCYVKCNYLEEICIKIGNIPKIFWRVTVLPAGKFTTLPWYTYDMSVQKNKIRKYSSHSLSLNVGIYNQNRLLKVIQMYRERYLYVWQTRKHEVYLLVSLERQTIFVIKIHIWPKTLIWTDTPDSSPHPPGF